MFDNSKPNIILLADNTDTLAMTKILGPHRVAYSLRQAGYEVTVIQHLSIFSISEIKRILDTAINDKTLFVGFSSFFYRDLSSMTISDVSGVRLPQCLPGRLLPHGAKFNEEIKNFIKNKNPKCKLVIGGPNAMYLDYNKIFDYIVLGYAEISAVNLANHLMDPSIPLNKSYRSIYGSIVVDDSRAEGFDIENSEMRYTDRDFILEGESLLIEISRGCIFKCDFCSFPLNGKKKMDYIRNKNIIRDELIDNYNRFGITKYRFSDDTFNDSVEKCRMFWELSQELPFKIEWWGYIRLDLLAAHPETIKYIFDSGCRSAYFGIETFNHNAAKLIGKGGRMDRMVATLNEIKRIYGDKVCLQGSFIFGLPHEDLPSMVKTRDFLLSDENPLDVFSCKPLRIRPSTMIYGNEFLSKIDREYTKYGYVDLDAEHSGSADLLSTRTKDNSYGAMDMHWANEHTTYTEMCDFVRAFSGEKKAQRISGSQAFELASHNIPLEHFLNLGNDEVDWHPIDKIKISRANEYKKKIFDFFGILPDENSFRYDYFTEYLKSSGPFQ